MDVFDGWVKRLDTRHQLDMMDLSVGGVGGGRCGGGHGGGASGVGHGCESKG